MLSSLGLGNVESDTLCSRSAWGNKFPGPGSPSKPLPLPLHKPWALPSCHFLCVLREHLLASSWAPVAGCCLEA